MTVIGGYLVFLAIVVSHVAIRVQRAPFWSAAWSDVVLLLGAGGFYATPLWIGVRIGRVPSSREGGRADEGDGLENR